jgi:hypothetical protein
VYMFALTVSLQFKLNSVPEFTETIENDIIPLLRHSQASKTRWRSSSQVVRKR